ncbi:hypothetical protein ABGB18_43695 [Nonomuraea sp. B12E4]|uniref:hypothetical protein n=1 Tax=Nonomuraea sp. B12E4 TaxID=3153564 RepID=UPI00325C8A99
MATLVLTGVATPAPAIGSADPTPPKPTLERPSGPPSYVTPEMQETFKRQRPLARAADTLRGRIDTTEKSGFAGIELGDGEIVLRWKGRPTRRVREAVRSLRSPAPVRIAPAAFSRGDLKNAAARLWAASGVESGGPVHAVKMSFDGSGLEVAVEPRTTRRGIQSLPEVGVPVQVIEREPMKVDTRCDDTVAWWGGGAIRNAKFGTTNNCGGTGQGYHCTAGFGVKQGSATYLLTAGHCGAPGDTFTDPFGQTIGTVSRGGERQAHDLLLIETTAGGRIWDGTPGVDDYSKPVVGWDWTHGDQFLCMSGATSGAVCQYRVDGSFADICGYDIYGSYECYNDMISARASGANASAEGDSGGPVFELEPSDWSRVRAMGTVTGSVSYNSAEWLVFQDFGTATVDFPGLTVITG